MPTYLVTYDLVAKSGEVRDYEPVYEALDTFDNQQVLYSVFLVAAPSAAAIEAALRPALRAKDRYFITRLHSNWYRYRAMAGINQWLAAHPPA